MTRRAAMYSRQTANNLTKRAGIITQLKVTSCHHHSRSETDLFCLGSLRVQLCNYCISDLSRTENYATFLDKL